MVALPIAQTWPVQLLTTSTDALIELSNPANDYGGGTTILGNGRVVLTASGVVPDVGVVNLLDATARLDLNNFDEAIGAFTGVSGTGVLLGTGTLTVDGTVSTAFDGFIGGGSGGLVKAGSSTLTLTGTNVFTGPVTIDSGTLAVNGPLNSDRITVAGGGTLAGGGSINRHVVVEGGGILAPGKSPGILRTGDATLQDNSSFHIGIGGVTPGDSPNNHDQLIVTGAVTIANNVALNVSALGGFVPTAGQTFVVINNDDAGPGDHSGSFDGLPEGGMITNFLGSGLNAVISYAGGDGNDIALSVVSPNSPPVANASGPYIVPEGGSLTLNGLLSSDPNQSASSLTYEWDFDADGQFDDATGPAQLSPLPGWMDPPRFSSACALTDSGGLWNVATTTVAVTNIGPTPTMLGAQLSSPVGIPIVLNAMATDPSPADTLAGFIFTWEVTQNGVAKAKAATKVVEGGYQKTMAKKDGSLVTKAYQGAFDSAFSFVPNSSGDYQITLTSQDKDGSLGTVTTLITAVDPVQVELISQRQVGLVSDSGSSHSSVSRSSIARMADTWCSPAKQMI